LEASLGKYLVRTYLEKTLHKKGLVEWLKVETLSSKPSTNKRKKKSISLCVSIEVYMYNWPSHL
jgi:hypothetical protein